MNISRFQNSASPDPENAEACFNAGINAMQNGDYLQAEAFFRQTLALAPDSIETRLNLGYVLDMQDHSDEALLFYKSVLSTAPHNPKARYNCAMHLLRSGDFLNGFAYYESRFVAVPGADDRKYLQPRWDGSPLNGRSILVYCEQGLGDALMFARFLPLLKQQNTQIVLEVQEPLRPLLTFVEGVDRVVAKSTSPPVTDLHIPLMSLPFMLGTTLDSIPDQVPYIRLPEQLIEQWRMKTNNSARLRVGLAWAGKAHPYPNRSCPPSFLIPLLKLKDIQFYSLQISEKDRFQLPDEFERSVTDLTADIKDFADSAALIANLDLIITIDTAIAHLAGALGRPVWIMLAHRPDWRWMLDRRDSPWYPTARLFRQSHPGNWGSIIMQLQTALKNLLSLSPDESIAELFEPLLKNALKYLENDASDQAAATLLCLTNRLPSSAAVWFNLGRAYALLGKNSDAITSLNRAAELAPESAALQLALGDLWMKEQDYKSAENAFTNACRLQPDSAEIWLQLGGTLSARKDYEHAAECCRQALMIRPGFAEALYNLGYIQLRTGNYADGFRNFEARLDIAEMNLDVRDYRQPRWDGSPLNGRSLLVYGEQGLGDVIQFARYIPLLATGGERILFEVDPPLLPLFRQFGDNIQLVTKSATPPESDLYIQSMSLAMIFGSTVDTIPAAPYLSANPELCGKWKTRFTADHSFKVGLVWRGSPRNRRDTARSTKLTDFLPLSDIPGISLYSLQVGAGIEELTPPPDGIIITDLSPLLTDFCETSAALECLDLLISVDTAVAHLAGALNRPVWLLLQEDSEWRWLDSHDDSPWYSSMRIFTKQPDESTTKTVERMADALRVKLAVTPDDTELARLYNLAATKKESGELDAAAAGFREIIRIAPDLPDPHHSLAVVLHLQGQLQEAIQHYELAISLDPAFVKAHYNLANALLRSGRYQEALVAVRQTISLDPDHADAHWLLGMLLLQNGDFQNGWREYEWRWQAAGFICRIPNLGRPAWDGSPLNGRTLLIHMEQGAGDMIQFIRYAKLCKNSGSTVIACATPELVRLLEGTNGIDMAVDRNRPLPDFDLHIPVQSLPYRLNTELDTIPAEIPYIHPHPDKVVEWRKRLPMDGRLRIGLAWQGAHAHIDDCNRSMKLEELLPLAGLNDCCFISLQLGEEIKQIDELRGRFPILDYSGYLHDFSDTAALISGLDLVISVDTAVAHLAGALGKPVWTLLPYIGEWRWLLNRDDSPWYPTMILFRQKKQGDWNNVVNRCVNQLYLILAERKNLDNRGIELLRTGDATGANAFFSERLTCTPEDPDLNCNQGVALFTLGKITEAIACYQKSIAIRPDFMQAYFNLGNALQVSNKTSEAIICYQKAVELDENNPTLLLALGHALKKAGQFAEAQQIFEDILSLDPNSFNAQHGIAEIRQAVEDFEGAIKIYRQLTIEQPENITTLNLLGTVYQSADRLEEAETCYRKALQLQPDQHDILNNLAAVLSSQGKFEEAICIYRHLVKIAPDYPEGHWNLAVALLSNGEYEEGWHEYEWRFRKINPVPQRDFSQPRWNGEPPNGRTILIHGEQGFGDTIQFARYALPLRALGFKVILECQTEALRLLLQSLEGIDSVIVVGEPLPDFDCHLPLMSLPLLFNTTVEQIPASIPYLKANTDRLISWSKKINANNNIKVGLAWYAKQSQILNRKRSCRLDLLEPIWSLADIDFYSLQVGIGSDQIADLPADNRLIDLTGQIHDFGDTAALISQLDLVITIDTVTAHLAGALGIPCWVMLPKVAEWRWLQIRTDSPWYPGMRLFRQQTAGDWYALACKIAEELQQLKPESTEIDPTPETKLLTEACKKPLLVGLAWSGRQDNPLNRKRSCPFEELYPLLETTYARFVSLQLDNHHEHPNLIDFTDQFADFSDTAALMANLDLIISIDTSVAHLAAATGRPTWLMLSYAADWRWMEGGDSTPWYPGMRIFRQPDHGDWSAVIQALKSELDRLIAGLPTTIPKQLYLTQNVPITNEHLQLERLLSEKQDYLIKHQNEADANLDVGTAMTMLGRYHEAIPLFQRTVELQPDHVTAHLNLAYSYLSIGDYLNGWHKLEWRLKKITQGELPSWPMLTRQHLDLKQTGKKVLVHCEQGFGDTIQFSRYLPLLAEAGYEITLSCQPEMTKLIESMGKNIRVIPHGNSISQCDFQILMLSLPLIFNTTLKSIPDKLPYMSAPEFDISRWNKYLQKKEKTWFFF